LSVAALPNHVEKRAPSEPAKVPEKAKAVVMPATAPAAAPAAASVAAAAPSAPPPTPTAAGAEAGAGVAAGATSKPPPPKFLLEVLQRPPPGSPCVTCSRSKTKCDRGAPCSRCQRLGLECKPRAHATRRQEHGGLGDAYGAIGGGDGGWQAMPNYAPYAPNGFVPHHTAFGPTHAPPAVVYGGYGPAHAMPPIVLAGAYAPPTSGYGFAPQPSFSAMSLYSGHYGMPASRW